MGSRRRPAYNDRMCQRHDPACARQPSKARAMCWFVYLIECRDRSIYTGITNDVPARYAAHASGRGARYTRAHPPLRLLAAVSFPDRSSAARAEYAVKQLSAGRKRALAAALNAVDVGRATGDFSAAGCETAGTAPDPT